MREASDRSGRQEPGDVHDRDAGEEAADDVARDERPTRRPGEVPADLDDHLEGRTGRGREEEHAQEVAR